MKLFIQKVQELGDYCLTILFFSLYYKHMSLEKSAKSIILTAPSSTMLPFQPSTQPLFRPSN